MYFTRDDLKNPIFWKWMNRQWIMHWVLSLGFLLGGLLFSNKDFVIFGSIYTTFMIIAQIIIWRAKVNGKREKAEIYARCAKQDKELEEL